MKAFNITAPGASAFSDLAEPTIAADDVLLQVDRVGLCGSDLNTWRGLNPLVDYPRIPGHEIAATILAKGDNVPDAIHVGDAVTLNPYRNCGDCPACRQGRINACRNNQTMGVQREGALTGRISAPWQRIVTSKVTNPNHLALIEPMAVGFHAVKRARVARDEMVLVFGCGAIGLGVIAGAARRGARVMAVDVDNAKLELAKAAGAVEGALAKDVAEAVKDFAKGDGVDVAIEAVGLPETFLACVDHVAPCGRVVYIGYSKSPVTYETKLILTKELDIMGSRGALQDDFIEAVEHIESGLYPADDTISGTYPFAQAAEALKHWAANSATVTKLVIDLSDEKEMV